MKKTLFIIIILLTSVFFFQIIPTPVTNALESGTWIISLGSDDAQLRRGSSEWWGVTALGMSWGEQTSSYYDFETGARFQSIGIPQGATIQTAVMNFTWEICYYVNHPILIIEGEDEDDTVTFSSATNYKGRVRTNANVSWVTVEHNNHDIVLTPDLSNIVQEIVDREGWTTSNDMTFFVSHALGWGGVSENCKAHSYEQSTLQAVRLHITWTVTPQPNVTFYNQSNSVFMTNGTKRLNGTTIEFVNNTILELQGIINISTQFIKWNITTGNIQINPYNYTITQNATIWLMVNAVSGGNGDGETLFLFGSVNAIPMNLLYYIALTTIGLTLMLKSQFLGKLLSALLFAFQAIWISGDILLDTQINYISAYNPTSGVYQYVNTVTHINTPILSFLIILSIGLALKGAIDTFSMYNKRKG